MLKSMADRLGIPQSTSSSSSSPSSPPPSSIPSPQHRSSMLAPSSSSAASSLRSPSRLQQHRPGSAIPSSIPGPASPAPPSPAGASGIPGYRKISLSTPSRPVPAPLNMTHTLDDAQDVSTSHTDAPPPAPSSTAKTENVTVTVRIRPFSSSELKVAGGPAEVWACDGATIAYADEYAVATRRAAVDYVYDHALTGSDNDLIYNTSVKQLVQSAMEGYNGTVFAYGQTSSGKTYTMSGTEKQPGITPRAVEDVFKYIRENSDREFLLRVSYLEIYNESIRDLLSPEAIDLRIHEDKRRGVYVSPLKEEIVTTPSQVMRIIERGDYQRHVSSTDFNAHSSRSHSIFQIVIESRDRSPAVPGSPTVRKPAFGVKSASAVRVSQLNLIDLAGSEKASSDVERRKEGAFINKSLLTLGTVISKLTEEKGAHIPYRDSKLTRILQSSLNGSARVSVICTISPSQLNVEESNNTLKFAARVKKVVTKAQTNQVMDDKALLEKYRREISELKAQLMLTVGAGGEGGAANGRVGEVDKGKQAELSTLLQKERLKHEEEMVEMNMVRNALKERIDHLTKLILTSQSINTKASPEQPAGRNTVETTSDGTVLEFPKEIESRLARKDAIVKQLQSEVEAQQEKMALMKAALEKTARGEVVDIEKTLARLEMEPREKFLIEKRASIMNLNSLVQESAVKEGEKEKESSRQPQQQQKEQQKQGHLSRDEKSLNGGEPWAMDEDEDEDEDLMDTPWNRAELASLRQAKRELEIVVMDQEKKLEDMVAFEDSEDFRNLVLELEEQREMIVVMEEEREGFKATITDLKNSIRKLEFRLSQQEAATSGSGGSSTLPVGGMASSSLPSLTTTTSGANGASAVVPPSALRIKELEMVAQKERRLRMDEQNRSMGRIASLEAELTMMKAELSVRHLAGYS